mmetsp:Transcript_39575/g.104871  ORF Transcript_39575/g.104871 Transcript_39575/m.104871 type:complete len:226 (-) Transcript_39575:1440-2117(-)
MFLQLRVRLTHRLLLRGASDRGHLHHSVFDSLDFGAQPWRIPLIEALQVGHRFALICYLGQLRLGFQYRVLDLLGCHIEGRTSLLDLVRSQVRASRQRSHIVLGSFCNLVSGLQEVASFVQDILNGLSSLFQNSPLLCFDGPCLCGPLLRHGNSNCDPHTAKLVKGYWVVRFHDLGQEFGGHFKIEKTLAEANHLLTVPVSVAINIILGESLLQLLLLSLGCCLL